ncbi:Tetratricopeptide repeat protein [Thalassoglobus neptunius]|uniref:Tetratricopeptide repeat protein n=2 Tax=Thalassoglobus neptunius TaxID=1938619 RepID=A0A5C5X2V0_9PLAN|nr:Tetratricopeptide repeat protein [Thalassoglobus neptunius]
MEGAPVLQVAMAYVNRGSVHGSLGDQKAAIEHFTRVIEMKRIPVILVAKAYFNRSYSHGLLGDSQAAIADLTQLIGLEDAPVDQVSEAYYRRGSIQAAMGRREEACHYLKSVRKISIQTGNDHVKRIVEHELERLGCECE